MPSISQARFEIIAIVLTALGKFLFYDILNQRLIYILIMFAFWGVYLIRKTKNHPENLIRWGLRTDNFKAVLKTVLPFGLLAIITCLVIGFIQHSINITWHIIPILILYPLFGTLQQVLLMSLFAGNMQDYNLLTNRSIIIVTSALFGLLHYPHWWLVLGTSILALFYSYVFLKQRNVYVLGIFHGWLGAIFYYTVVDKDPFIEVFGPILH
ncbi:CPBP family glutamic-type intramembrane protease [Ekhidna sp.]|uniref:CPBP family glutamic-type intramembrane protease n=1 Tax=Ekhidna sp. TaxID=2608089 RepID=UPI003CCBAA8E